MGMSAEDDGGYKSKFSAATVRVQAMGALGKKKFYDDFAKQWDEVRKGGAAKGMGLAWGEGMEDLGEGWVKLCKGEVDPSEELVSSL